MLRRMGPEKRRPLAPVAMAASGDGFALVGVRGEDQARDVFGVVAARDEFAREVGEEVGMRGRAARPVVGGLHQAEAHVALPDAIDDDLREAFVVRRDDEGSDFVA